MHPQQHFILHPINLFIKINLELFSFFLSFYPLPQIIFNLQKDLNFHNLPFLRQAIHHITLHLLNYQKPPPHLFYHQFHPHLIIFNHLLFILNSNLRFIFKILYFNSSYFLHLALYFPTKFTTNFIDHCYLNSPNYFQSLN